jgi:hypothetical protein
VGGGIYLLVLLRLEDKDMRNVNIVWVLVVPGLVSFLCFAVECYLGFVENWNEHFEVFRRGFEMIGIAPVPTLLLPHSSTPSATSKRMSATNCRSYTLIPGFPRLFQSAALSTTSPAVFSVRLRRPNPQRIRNAYFWVLLLRDVTNEWCERMLVYRPRFREY